PGWVRQWVRQGNLVRQALGSARRVAGRLLGPGGYGGVAGVLDPDRFPPTHRPVLEAHYRLARAYRPGGYAGRVWVLRARIQPLWGGPPADLGWGPFAAGGVEVSVVPGDHETVVSEAGGVPVAAALDRALEAAEAHPPTADSSGIVRSG